MLKLSGTFVLLLHQPFFRTAGQPLKSQNTLNIKETFLDHTDNTGFSRFIRELIFSEYLDVYQLERYTHRLSMEGVPLKYFALVGRLTASIPLDFLTSIGVVSD